MYVGFSGLITSVREERANGSAIVYLYLCGFSSEGLPIPLVVWHMLRYFIVELSAPFL